MKVFGSSTYLLYIYICKLIIFYNSINCVNELNTDCFL